MRFFYLTLLVLLPFVAQSYNAQFGSYTIDSMSLIYRGVYLFNQKDSPRVKKNGKSEISLDFKVKPKNVTSPLYGTVETLITTEDVFRNIGYIDSRGKRIACCDEDAYKRNKCKNMNSLFIPEEAEGKYELVKTVLNGGVTPIKIQYKPTQTGMYYVVAAICDYHVSPLIMEGNMIVENPYGHLPATQYGSLPFYSFMCFAYIISLIVWGMLCISFSKEIMSVQIIILVVLVSFVIDNIIKSVYLTVFNNTGNSVYFLAILSISIDCATRTLTRVLTVVVCMGLGVCRATLGSSTCKFLFFGIAYYIVSFWDSYCSLFPSFNAKMEFVRLFFTSGMDAMVYFWIFQSLMDTMDELNEKKQVAKLIIFSKLRNLLIVSVVVATATLTLFSYIIVSDYNRNIWRYQWFINDGIWSLYYFLLFFFIMLMWKPSENSSAYAYHIQVPNDVEDNDEYGLPIEKLVDSDDEGTVIVNTIDSEMKPMIMSETVHNN